MLVRHDDGEQAWSACSTLSADEARLLERPMRSATSGTTTPREMWEPSVPGVLEKLQGPHDGCACDVEGSEGGPFRPSLWWTSVSADKKVEDPADELKEMAEARAKAWQAETSAAEAWMAELLEFEESRMSSSGADGETEAANGGADSCWGRLSRNSQNRALALNDKRKEHCETRRDGYSCGHRQTNRQTDEHGARWVASRWDGGGEADAQATHREPEGSRGSELSHWMGEAVLSWRRRLVSKTTELKSQLDKMDAMIWEGCRTQGTSLTSLRARLEQVESQVTQLLERIKGEIRAEAPDATSAQVTALTKQLDEKVGAISSQLMEKGVVTKQLPAREEDCDLLRPAGAWLQAHIAQLEPKLDSEIEQLNDELAGLETGRIFDEIRGEQVY